MNPEEIQKIREKYGITPISRSQSTQPVQTIEEKLRFLKGENAPVETKPKRPYGIAGEEIQKTGEQFAKTFEEAPGIVGKTAAVATLPLRAVGTGARIVGKAIAEPLAPAIEKAFQALPEQQKTDLSNFFTEAGKKLESVKEAVGDDVYQSLVDIFDVASLVGGGKAATTPAKAVGEAALKGGKEATEAVIKATSEVTTATGRALKGVGEVSVQSAITPTAKEAERILAYRAKEPFFKRIASTLRGTAERPITRAQTAIEKGVQGTETMIGTQAKRLNQKLWNETIAPAVEKSPKVISQEDMFSPIEKLIAETTEPGRKQAFQDAFDAIKSDFKQYPENVSLKDAQKLKSELDEFTPEKIFKGKSVANEYATLKNEIANEIRKITYETLDDVNIKKSYLDWANLKELEKVGVKALTEAGRQAGSGKLVSYLWDMATIPVKTIGGRVLYRVGNAVEFIGEKGIKKFSDYLLSKGISR